MIVGVPVQVPVEPLTVEPSVSVPLIAGRTVLTGAVATMTADAAAVAEELPAAFVPVTTTRAVPPTSVEVRM